MNPGQKETMMSKRLVKPISPAALHLAEQVLLRRRARHLTQAALAEAVGCSMATISNLETKKLGDVTLENLLALAKALETTPHELIGWPPEAGHPVAVAAAAPFQTASVHLGACLVDIEDVSAALAAGEGEDYR
jgi:transcriptional regulator with XRE-family HTH domain